MTFLIYQRSIWISKTQQKTLSKKLTSIMWPPHAQNFTLMIQARIKSYSMKKSKRKPTVEEILLARSFAWLLYDIYDNLLYYRKAPTKKELEKFKDKIHAILSATERNTVFDTPPRK